MVFEWLATRELGASGSYLEVTQSISATLAKTTKSKSQIKYDWSQVISMNEQDSAQVEIVGSYGEDITDAIVIDTDIYWEEIKSEPHVITSPKCDSKTKRKRRSAVWCLFTKLDQDFALCNLCNASISYRSSISNLKRHHATKHSVIASGESNTSVQVCISTTTRLKRAYLFILSWRGVDCTCIKSC